MLCSTIWPKSAASSRCCSGLFFQAPRRRFMGSSVYPGCRINSRQQVGEFWLRGIRLARRQRFSRRRTLRAPVKSMRSFAKRPTRARHLGVVVSRGTNEKREQAPRTPHASRGMIAMVVLWAVGICPILVFAWPLPAQILDLPPRPKNALSGTEFTQRITPLDLAKREEEIFAQVTSGNVPDFLRRLRPV